MMGDAVARKQPKTVNQLQKCIKQAYTQLTQSSMRKKLIESMPSRLKDVIKNKGGMTKY